MALNSKPVILWDNLLALGGAIAATDTDADSQYDPNNLKDFRVFNYWKAASVGTKYLTFDNNCLTADNADWEQGDTSNWTLYNNGGAGASSALSSVSAAPYEGAYNGKVTITTGGVVAGDIQLYRADVPIVKGRTYLVIVIVKAAASRTATLGVRGNISPYTNYGLLETLSLTTSWQVLPYKFTATHTDPAARLQFGLGGDTNDVEIDAVTVGLPVDAMGLIGHNLFSCAATVSLEYSSDNFSADVQEAVAGFIPGDNKALLKTFTSVNAKYWRIKIVSASVVPYLSVASLGPRLTMEKYLEKGFDPSALQPESSGARSMSGGHMLGTVMNYQDIPISLSFRTLTESFCDDTFLPAWNMHLGLHKPFFFAWDVTNHSDKVYYMWVPPGGGKKMPYQGLTRDLTFQIAGPVE